MGGILKTVGGALPHVGTAAWVLSSLLSLYEMMAGRAAAKESESMDQREVGKAVATMATRQSLGNAIRSRPMNDRQALALQMLMAKLGQGGSNLPVKSVFPNPGPATTTDLLAGLLQTSPETISKSVKGSRYA